MLVGTPSGVSLAPEGGAHQSVYTPLIGMGQPGLTAYEPAYVDELSEILRWGFAHMQDEKGGAVYLRLSTRPLAQPSRAMTEMLRDDVLAGAYWLEPPADDAELAVVACGAVLPDAIEAHRQLSEDLSGVGLLVVTSPDRLERDWRQAMLARTDCHIARLLSDLSQSAAMVSVLDGHPASLSWLGAVRQHRILALGVDRFGQSGDIPDLYRALGIDAEAIVSAAARLIAG
jgi:pyruvate dehydrogenase E1 component